MKNKGFRQIYMGLSRENKQQIQIRNQITSACGVSTMTFYNWLMQITRIPDVHKATIAQILNVNVSDLD